LAKVERFEDLTCWREARGLVNEVYRLVEGGRLAKDFRLRDQLTGAAVSVMTNIAEGFARYSRKEFIRFLGIAQSSAAEVKSPLYVVLDQKYASPERVETLQKHSETCQKMILGPIKHLRRTLSSKGGKKGINEPPARYAPSPKEEHPAAGKPKNASSAYDLARSFTTASDA
jgi:four helix bundle protein